MPDSPAKEGVAASNPKTNLASMDYGKESDGTRTCPFSFAQLPSDAEHNLRKILAICSEPWAFRRLHEVFADQTTPSSESASAPSDSTHLVLENSL